MFTEINEIEEIGVFLEGTNNSGDEIVIHYACADCGDEQVTDFIEIDENMLAQWKKKQEIMVSYECTNCAVKTLYLTFENIIGYETN